MTVKRHPATPLCDLHRGAFCTERGVSIVEVVLTLVVIAILIAIAVPKFVDLSDDAKQKATTAIADGLNAASSTNALLSKTGDLDAISVTNCTNVASALPNTFPLPAGYTITSQAIPSGSTTTCTVTNPNGSTTATFIGRSTA
jgi:MSHA pilin protein MshA